MSPDGFRAMGVDVVVGGARGTELGRIARLFDEWERVFSRFWPASELNRVNASPAPTVLVTPLFAQAVRVALDAARATRGIVDPSLGAAVEAAGYDRDFSLIDPDGPLGPAHRGCAQAVELAGRLLSRPPGVKLDLNGVVKAMAVDRAVGMLRAGGFVSAGGDVATSCPTVVSLPARGSVRLEQGGLATSGTTLRRWTRAGAPQHHLIDPATGRPSEARWRAVTVAAGTCLAADVAAKAAFLLSGDGPDWLDEHGLPGRFLSEHGVLTNAAWRAALEPVHAAA